MTKARSSILLFRIRLLLLFSAADYVYDDLLVEYKIFDKL